MRVSDFDYDLPPELVAQSPSAKRAQSRMLIVDRQTDSITVGRFADLVDHVRPGDCVVVNDSKVIPARVYGRKQCATAQVEALLLEDIGNGHWTALLRPGKRLKSGMRILISDAKDCWFDIVGRRENGEFEIRFPKIDISILLDQHGHIPLPPYINRDDTSTDHQRYQTVYAHHSGSIAAPTAGLHFDNEMITKLSDRNVTVAPVTLHINYATFKPIKSITVEDHQMHHERFQVTEDSANSINEAKSRGGSVIAIGTTVVRVLETCADENGLVKALDGKTDIFLYPPRRPIVVDALLTNFHLPKSTLLMLVCTLAPQSTVMEAYQTAIRERFRFYSYGDCMLIK